MGRCTARAAPLALAAFAATPCGAQQVASQAPEQSAASALSAAIDALEREEYGTARALIAAVERQSSSPFERSRLEQILFNVAYREERFEEAHEHLERAIDAGGLTEPEVAQARYLLTDV